MNDSFVKVTKEYVETVMLPTLDGIKAELQEKEKLSEDFDTELRRLSLCLSNCRNDFVKYRYNVVEEKVKWWIFTKKVKKIVKEVDWCDSLSLIDYFNEKVDDRFKLELVGISSLYLPEPHDCITYKVSENSVLRLHYKNTHKSVDGGYEKVLYVSDQLNSLCVGEEIYLTSELIKLYNTCIRYGNQQA